MKFTFDNKGELTHSTEGNLGVIMRDTKTGTTQVVSPQNSNVTVIGTGRQWFTLPQALGGGKAYLLKHGTSPCPFCSKPSQTYHLERQVVLVLCYAHENPYMWGVYEYGE